MGCTTSRIDQLPAVTLCHQRCKLLEEALEHSYALADAHVSYIHSLKSLGPILHRFFAKNLTATNLSDSLSNSNPEIVTKLNPSKPSSPDHCPSSSNSEKHIDFPSDSDDEEFIRDDHFDASNRTHPNYFNHQTLTPARSDSYSYYTKNGESAWKTPSPPPPSSSTWDFLNFFDSYDRYEIPAKNKEELIQHVKTELVNETGDDKFVGKMVKERQGAKMMVENMNVQEKFSAVEKYGGSQDEDNIEKKDYAQPKSPSVFEVMKEVEVMFERAAESGNEVLKILDTATFRYYHKHSVYQGVSSKMLRAFSPFFLDFSSSVEKNVPVHVGFGEDLGVVSVNLSSTLKKLCLWEKKLYDEVKAEEKLRIIYGKYCRQMRGLGVKGVEANKVDSAQNLIRILSTKIKVAIHVIDKISVTINKLRDEELWPQISDLIQKLLGMWQRMLECHTCQSQAVLQARSLDAITSIENFSVAHLEDALKLKFALQNWDLSFSNWVTAQNGYAKALNGWLLRCLPSKPEEMSDVIGQFSPGRMGEPPVFAFCNQWSQALDRVSELEASDAIKGLFQSVSTLLDRHYVNLQQGLTADKHIETTVKILEREGQRMQKLMQTRGKKTFQACRNGEPARQNELTKNSSLHLGLRQIFMAIERFSANTVQAYEELHGHIEQSKLADRENPGAP